MNDIQTPLANKSEEKKARGGQKKKPLEIARVKLWCLGVKSRTNFSYKTLDEMFLNKNPNEVFFEPPKAFEKIARNGVSPPGNDRRRSILELVKVVDRHPNFQGTAIVFNSRFWELLELQSISEADIVIRINDVFIEHGVQRYAFPAQEESWRIGRNPELDKQPPINSMEMMLLQNANLHKITWEYLMMLLYFFTRTTILRDEKRMLEVHTSSLKKYFEESLGDLGKKCSEEALKRIQGLEVVKVF